MHAVEDWISYGERLEFYFAANKVKEGDKQRAVLFGICGAATYKLTKNLLIPAKPTSFKDIVKLLTEHYQPKPSRVAQCYTVNSCVCKQGESVVTYVAEPNPYLNIMSLQLPLMIYYVIAWPYAWYVHINNSCIQCHLLAEPDLTFITNGHMGNTQESHLANLEAVQFKLQTAGLHLKCSKCTFVMPSIGYLGH